MARSYPRWDGTPDWKEIPSRPLLPIGAPPPYARPPALPSPPRKPSFDAPFTLSTHIVPAAYPRTSPDIPLPELPSSDTEETTRKSQLGKIRDTILRTQEDIVLGKYAGRGDNPKILWNCVDRYVRREVNSSGTKGVTLFLAHANGFPKEIWETTLKYLLATKSDFELVDEIWSFEAVQHGDSALLNSANLGLSFDCQDHARDTLNFLLHFLPSDPSTTPLPTHLVKVPEAESNSRKARGFSDRRLVAITHSFGGCTTALAAINTPALFDSIMLIDPIVARPIDFKTDTDLMKVFILNSLQKRDHWTSREEALHSFSTNPFSSGWHSDVIKLYVECSLTDDPEGGVRLKMPGIHEAGVFVDARSCYEAFTLLPKLDKKVKLRWVMPGRKSFTSVVGGKENAHVSVWQRPENSSNVIIPDMGHLMVQEAPRLIADEIRALIEEHRPARNKL